MSMVSAMFPTGSCGDKKKNIPACHGGFRLTLSIRIVSQGRREQKKDASKEASFRHFIVGCYRVRRTECREPADCTGSDHNTAAGRTAAVRTVAAHTAAGAARGLPALLPF